MHLFEDLTKNLTTATHEFLQPKVLKGAFLAFLILAGVASCTSCRHDVVQPVPIPTVVPTVEIPPLPAVQIVESQKASVTLPLSFQNQQTDNTSNYRLYANMTSKELLSLDSKEYLHSYEEFVLESIRSIKEQSAIVQSSQKTTINGQDLTIVESSKEAVTAWVWLTVKNGIGYTFTCGGLESSNQSLHDLCFGIANTILIK